MSPLPSDEVAPLFHPSWPSRLRALASSPGPHELDELDGLVLGRAAKALERQPALLALLKRAADAIKEEWEDSEGQRMNTHVACPVCDGGVPMGHSLMCDVEDALRKAEAK